jgi:hypothetical protein
MKARDMLQLSDERFREEVSRAISPKPWKHRVSPYMEGCECVHCGHKLVLDKMKPKQEVWAPGHWQMVFVSEGCPVPPKLTDPLEVVVRKLRDRCRTENREGKFLDAMQDYLFDMLPATMAHSSCIERTMLYWLSGESSVQEEIALRLVALGLWEM